MFTPDEVPVPGFLFDDLAVRKELSHYYSSVRRADDCVGEVLAALEASGHADDTFVLFLSDHGMALPFAKTQLYHHSTHTPLLIRWPGVTQPGSVDEAHMVSAVDFVPTLMDVCGLECPQGLDGRSFAPVLHGESQGGCEFVIKEYNENSGASRDPMRAVQSKRFLYIFNPWSNGERIFATATTGTPTYRRMAELAKTDARLAARLDLYQHRVPEELYDVVNDPDCLHNLIGDPAYTGELAPLLSALESSMASSNDPVLPVFQNRDDAAAREAYVQQVEKEAQARRAQKRKKTARGECTTTAKSKPETHLPENPRSDQRRGLRDDPGPSLPVGGSGRAKAARHPQGRTEAHSDRATSAHSRRDWRDGSDLSDT